MRRGRRWRAPLLRQALALLVPVFGLAGVAVFRAGVSLEKPGPRHGDLVGAVRVLFQDVAGDIVGPCLDIDRLLCPDGARTCDQENRDRNAGGELLRKHAFTSQTCWAACPGFEATSFRAHYYIFGKKRPSLTAAAGAVGRVSEAEPAIFPSATNGGLRCAPPAYERHGSAVTGARGGGR